MTRYFTNTFSTINLHKSATRKSEIITQMIFGDSFSIIKKFSNWFKIRIKEDGYVGFIQNKNYETYLKPTHKIYKLKAKVYKFANKRKKTNELTFGSKIKITDRKFKFFKFNKGWINQSEVKPISFVEKNVFKRIMIFKNTRYKWGGKSFKGIDCSALVQVFLNFNNRYCPRDTKDQVKYLKKNVKLKNVKKNDIIFWKGHVAIALSKKKLIHAYGPMKKTVIGDIDIMIKRIKKSASLKITKIKRF